MRTIISAGNLTSKVLEITNREDDTEMLARLEKELNRLYLRTCASHPFEMLRRSAEFSGAASVLLPANAAGVRWIVDENDVVYRPRDDGPASTTRNYFVLNTVTGIPGLTALPFLSEDCVVNSGENTVVSAALASAIAQSRIPGSVAVTGADSAPGSYTFIDVVNEHPHFSFVSGVDTYEIEHNGSIWIYRKTGTSVEDLFGVGSSSYNPPTSGWVSLTTGAPALLTLAYTAVDGIDPVGEFMKIGDEDELFAITKESGSTFTIDRTFRADSVTAGALFVRPPITQEVSLYDENGEAVDDVDFTVYYWIIPPALRRSSDIVLLPSSEALELQLLRASPEAKETRPVGQAEIVSAINRVRGMNLDKMPIAPRESRVKSILTMNTKTIYSGTR